MSRIIIDRQKCKACLLCKEACPKGMISQDDKLNNYGVYPIIFLEEKNQCTGCAMCAQSCPDIAIKEVYR